MDDAEIIERTKKMGSKGVDLRTAIVDLEGRIGRQMDAREHQVFITAWQSTTNDRRSVYARRAQEAADAAFRGIRRRA